MALDPRLSLMGQVPSVNQFFQGAQLGQQLANQPLQNQLLQQKVQAGQNMLDQAPLQAQLDQQRLAIGEQSIAQNQQALESEELKRTIFGARKVIDAFERNDNNGVISSIKDTFQDPQEQAEQIAEYESDRVNYIADMRSDINSFNAQEKGNRTGLASAVTKVLDDGTVIQSLPSGKVDVRDQAGNLITGKDRVKAIEQSKASALATKKAEARVEIEKAQEIAGAKAREARISDIKKDLSTSNRDSARTIIRLNQGLKLAEKSAQGLSGSAKLQLAKLFPGIDVSNEAALDQTFKQLALDQLQSFKGPTTDFEFNIAQSTVGDVGDSRTANVSRLKSLQRANWFTQREFTQFNKFVKAGGDPDSFSFNFSEPIKTGKGVFTLQQLQDTAVAKNISIDDVLKKLGK